MSKGNIKPGYEHINVHTIFDIRKDGKFTIKAILTAGSHTTAPLSSITYSIVVSRESIMIEFILESLNNLDIFACDLGNSYPNAK